MAVLIGLLLVLFSIGVVLYPFLKTRRLSGDATAPSSLDELVEMRHAIYANINTLELERGLGNVDEEEYSQRLERYRLEAAATFREQEKLDAQVQEAEQALEDEVRQVRQFRIFGQAQQEQEGHRTADNEPGGTA